MEENRGKEGSRIRRKQDKEETGRGGSRRGGNTTGRSKIRRKQDM